MAKFAEADARKFKNVFVCKRCKVKTRTSMRKVLEGKAKCKKCKSPFLRPKRKKK